MLCGTCGLWFDVEKRYNTTSQSVSFTPNWLWFDVEKRYNTTVTNLIISSE